MKGSKLWDLLEQLSEGGISLADTHSEITGKYFTREELKLCADFWNGKRVEEKYFKDFIIEQINDN
mgnify:CR=1 FL=1